MANLFSDGFESGNLTAWSGASTSSGDLSVTEAAKLHGTWGLNCFIDDTNDKFVYSLIPSSETRVRVRFYIDINGLTIGNYTKLGILWLDTGSEACGVKLGNDSDVGGRYISTYGYTDISGAVYGEPFLITDDIHYVEVDWKASSAPAANDGFIKIWVDGILKDTIPNMDNDTKTISDIWFGTFSLSAGTSGTLFLDDFASNDDGSEIGVIAEGYEYVGSGTFNYSGSYTLNFTYTGQTGIWSGLGMGTYWSWDSYVNTIIANGIHYLRMDIPSYENTTWLANSKTGVLSAITKGATIIWGVSTGTTLTSSNWATYVTAVESAATWAQANGVFEFQLGNELEYRIDGTTLTLSQLITNLKSLATSVQAIFTNGNISYSSVDTYVAQAAWIAAGRGNIDILACNIYKGGTYEPYNYDYQTRINSLMTAFGADHFYLTEFAPSYTALDHYSANEAVQAAAVTEIIDFIKSIGMTRAIYFCWKDDPPWQFGVVKVDENYRQLWQSLLNSGGSSFRFSGSAGCSHSIEGYIGSGSFNFSGTGVCYKEIPYITTGTITFSGSATQTYTFVYFCAASGSLELSGIGTYVLGFVYGYVIDIGRIAIERNNHEDWGLTEIIGDNPANATGKITSIEIYAYENMTGVEVATFTQVSAGHFSTRDSETVNNGNGVGVVIAGSKQTFTVDLDVVIGDFIGISWSSGSIFIDYSGGIDYFGHGDLIPCTNQLFSEDTYKISLYGTGIFISGTYSFSGTGSCIFGVSYIGSGTFTYSGVAVFSYETEVVNFLYAATGSFTYSGIAVQIHTRNYLYTGSGELIYSGSAVVELKNFLFMGSGTITFSGNAIYRYKVFWTKVNKVKGDWERVYKE